MKNDFQDWVESIGGPNEAAKRIGCSGRAVRKWANRQSMPRITYLQKIIRAARGELTIESVIQSIKKPGN